MPRRAVAERSCSFRPERPLALVIGDSGRQVLAAVDQYAAAAGLIPGQPLADARVIAPSLLTAAHDPVRDARALRRLARWCALYYSPWAAPCSTAQGRGEGAGGGGGLLLDVTGCAHLFRPSGGAVDAAADEAALAADLLRRLEGLGFSARAGVASSIGAAWAVARFATTAAQPCCLVPPGGLRRCLAPLPPAALRLSPADCELMARFGLSTVGELLALPPAVLTPRFGPGAARRLAQALGTAAEPVSPLEPVTPHRAAQRFVEPLATGEALARALEALLAVLCRQLERDGLGARRLELTCARVDGSLLRLVRGTSRPGRAPGPLFRLFEEEIGDLDPGFGVEVVALSAPRSEPLAAEQLTLPAAGMAKSGGGGEHKIPGGLVDRLAARLGAAHVYRLRPRCSHIPERAQTRGSLMEETPGSRAEEGWQGLAPRPLRLLPRPEPIEAMALLPDHPPARFRWRRLLHQVVRAEGPERLTAEWWLSDARLAEEPARDYFRIEDRDGRRYWVYRAAGRWYLQGIFG
jgi:protein ImuB